MKKYKVIVAGGRNYNDYINVKSYLYPLKIYCENNNLELVIVCGMATGVDSLGLRFAEENNLEILKYPADWNKYGKRAGYLRNYQMGEIADSAIVFWDGKSPGTKMMIDIMNNFNKTVKIVRYE